jgi:CRP-like cAMP-binding protein
VPVLLTGSGNAPITGGRFLLCESGEVGKINSRRVAAGTLPYPQASLLGRLTDRTREDFLAVGVSEGRSAGVTIISQGDSDSSAMLLLHGSVKVLATDPAGERTLLAIRVGGDLVGEMAALDVGPRSATVIACTDIFFKRITRAELRNFLARHPDAAIEVATMLSERLRWADRRRIEHGRPASVRVQAQYRREDHPHFSAGRSGQWPLPGHRRARYGQVAGSCGNTVTAVLLKS